MVEVERKNKKTLPTTRIISIFILILSIIGLSFSTNKMYEFYTLKVEQKELVERKKQLNKEIEEFHILLDEENYNIVTYEDGYCYNTSKKTAYKCKG